MQNQHTLVNAVVPTYDLDDNMLTYAGWNHIYAAENRLIYEENGSDKYEYIYDYAIAELRRSIINGER